MFMFTFMFMSGFAMPSPADNFQNMDMDVDIDLEMDTNMAPATDTDMDMTEILEITTRSLYLILGLNYSKSPLCIPFQPSGIHWMTYVSSRIRASLEKD